VYKSWMLDVSLK